MTKATKAAELLKVLGQRLPERESPAPKTRPTPRSSAALPRQSSNLPAKRQSDGAVRGVRGRKIDFYLQAQDEKLIREFAVWLAPHRKRINDSLVVKAVLRAAKTGPGLLAGYDAAVVVDGRSKLQNGRRDGE